MAKHYDDDSYLDKYQEVYFMGDGKSWNMSEYFVVIDSDRDGYYAECYNTKEEIKDAIGRFKQNIVNIFHNGEPMSFEFFYILDSDEPIKIIREED